jgi:hypothetical protein
LPVCARHGVEVRPARKVQDIGIHQKIHRADNQSFYSVELSRTANE